MIKDKNHVLYFSNKDCQKEVDEFGELSDRLVNEIITTYSLKNDELVLNLIAEHAYIMWDAKYIIRTLCGSILDYIDDNLGCSSKEFKDSWNEILNNVLLYLSVATKRNISSEYEFLYKLAEEYMEKKVTSKASKDKDALFKIFSGKFNSLVEIWKEDFNKRCDKVVILKYIDEHLKFPDNATSNNWLEIKKRVMEDDLRDLKTLQDVK